MKYSDFELYKHDVIGKLNLVQSMLGHINQENYRDDDNIEIVEAVHEVLVKMVERSDLLLNSIKPPSSL